MLVRIALLAIALVACGPTRECVRSHRERVWVPDQLMNCAIHKCVPVLYHYETRTVCDEWRVRD